MKKLRFKKTLTLIIVLLITAYGFFIDSTNPVLSDEINFSDGNLYSCYIDVGQGDCEIIKLPDKRIIMIDAGVQESFDDIDLFLSKNNITKIDYLIASHPHSDHIGSMEQVVRNYDIGEIYMPKLTATSQMFENLLLAVREKKIDIHTAKAGVSMISENDISAEFVAPHTANEDDYNNSSAILLLKYKNTSFLYTGDAEKAEEETVTADISADVLKVGHHGSKTSTSEEFLEKINPQIAVISCGTDNSYGHPHYQVIKRLEEYGCDILRTDEMGTIMIGSDGKNILK